MGEQYHAADTAETQLDELRAKRSQMASTYNPGSEVFQQLDAQIASLSSAAKARTGEARSRAARPSRTWSIRTSRPTTCVPQPRRPARRQPADVLTQQLAQINAHLDDLETQRNQYDDLTRAVQIQNDTYRRWRSATRPPASRPTATRRRFRPPW